MDSAGGMPQFKAINSKDHIEDKVQRRVLQMILKPGDERGSGVPLYLEQLAAELLSEDRPTFLSRDCIERVFMETLSTFYAGYDPPFSYLVACYPRALDKAYCYTTRCVVKTSKASAEIHKVAELAVASVVCFSLQAFVVLFFDNPVSFYFCSLHSILTTVMSMFLA
ncbi:unnamed protein product [Sphagnum tenellum]